MLDKFKFEAPRDHKAPLRADGLKKGDLPGTDTYDDGLDEKGRLVQPGSTATESGGTYMEDKGPIDRVHKQAQAGESLEGMKIVDPSHEEDDEDDAAARWLKENDPTLY